MKKHLLMASLCAFSLSSMGYTQGANEESSPLFGGWYGGVQAGFGQLNSEWVGQNWHWAAPDETLRITGTSGFFGLRAGYDWRLGSSQVLGVFAEGSICGFDTRPKLGQWNDNEKMTMQSKASVLGSLRGRYGWELNDKVGLVLTGGLAFSHT